MKKRRFFLAALVPVVVIMSIFLVTLTTASFPTWLKTFAKINPEAKVVDALKALLFKGVDMGSILTDILVLLAFTAVMMTTAVVTFKRTL